ncbi:MAG: sigma-54 dependent transcriptional regulator [Deltaproteobacteria bacterium]|nr:sigma-54 dependent transcriptional regulator [Deltaproteobacteria bacterium]
MKRVKYRGTVLVVDDEDTQGLISDILTKKGLQVITAGDGEEAISMLNEVVPDIIILNIEMPGTNGVETIRRIKEKNIPSIIIVTVQSDIQSAIHAVKLGVYKFIVKPFDKNLLINIVNEVIEKKFCMEDMNGFIEGERSLSELMGKSNSIRDVIQRVNKVAKTDYTVIIEGETGTGKELIASAIYKQSKRHNGPFIIVDCGAIPETLIESEIFGHEKGAFTGAHQKKNGYFSLANHGTIFFDEISNLPLTSQCKFLRAIEERRIHAVGSESTIPVDVRIIAASNLPLDREVTAGRFRNDLYHRLNEFCITLPSLRERKEDIIFLAERFVRETSGELKKATLKFSDEAMEHLVNHPWPGNVREIRNTIRRAALLADNVIRPEDLSLKTRACNVEDIDTADAGGAALTFKEVSHKATAEAERAVIQDALNTTKGNKSKAAKLLNIDYKTLYYKIKNYRISILNKSPHSTSKCNT